MAEEKPKVKSLKLKPKESSGSELLKSALKKPSSEKGTPDRKDHGNSKGKEPVTPGSSTKDPVRSSFGKNLVKVGKEFAKSNGKEQVASKDGKKQEQRVKDEAKSPIKVSSKEGRTSVKEEAKSPIKVLSKEKENANGKEKGKSLGKDAGKVMNGKEQGKSVGKESGKANGKSSGGVRDLAKVKDEGKDLDREKEKGKSSVVAKSPLAKTSAKLESASKMSPKATTKALPSVGQSVKKKVTQTTTTTVTTTKTVTEQKKEKKVYELPGQKHDPPEERDALRIFYSTLREQVPESEMAEIWLMEYGLLSHDEAKKAFERKQKRTQSSKQGGPASKAAASTPSRLSNGSPGVKKSTTPVSNGKGTRVVAASATMAKKKRASDDSDSDSDDDFLQNVVTKNKKKLKT